MANVSFLKKAAPLISLVCNLSQGYAAALIKITTRNCRQLCCAVRGICGDARINHPTLVSFHVLSSCQGAEMRIYENLKNSCMTVPSSEAY